MRLSRLITLASLSLLLTACGDTASLAVEEGIGPEPELPEPDESLFPTVNIAPAKG